jgi:hypothetical protein
MRLSDAVRFSTVAFRLLILCSSRFCTAPSLARSVETVPMALATAVIAALAVAADEMLPAPVAPNSEPVPLAAMLPIDTDSVSPALAPTWNCFDV